MNRIPNIFTMESSFCGNDKGQYAGMHLTAEALESVGRDLCRTLLVYCELSIPKELCEDYDEVTGGVSCAANAQDGDGESPRKRKKPKIKEFKKMLAQQLLSNNQLMKQGEDDDSSGSDGAPSEDNLEAEDIIKIVPATDAKTRRALARKSKPKKKVLEKQKPPILPQPPKTDEKVPPAPSKKEKASGCEEDKNEELKESGGEAKDKKPKVDMVDAWTQTERSDYSIIK